MDFLCLIKKHLDSQILEHLEEIWHYHLDFVKILLENEQFVTPGSATLILSHFSSHLILLEPGLVVLYKEIDGVALAEEGNCRVLYSTSLGIGPIISCWSAGPGWGSPTRTSTCPCRAC